jgi:hypothetical protein
MEFATSRVEGTLLLLGRAVGDQRSTFVIQGGEHHLSHRSLPQPRALEVLFFQTGFAALAIDAAIRPEAISGSSSLRVTSLEWVDAEGWSFWQSPG